MNHGLNPFFHLSPRLCSSTAGCSPPSMSSIVFCLLLSCFTFHLGFVHPLQDVVLHQCLPLSSVCCFLVSPSPRLCPSTAGCSLPSMPSIVLCLLLSCFTFHLGFVHPLQDVSPPPMPSIVLCLLLSCPRWFPPSLLCRLATFCSVVLLISS